MILFGALVTPEMIAGAPNADQLRLVESQTGLPLKAMLIVCGIVFMLPGIAFIILGFFVRKGGIVGCVLGAVLTGITILLLLFQFASVLIQRLDASALVGGFCIFLLPALLCILLITWLIQAIRAAPAVAGIRNQFNTQYWQAYQNQQQYAQGGYGYGPGPAAGGYPIAPPGMQPMPQPTSSTTLISIWKLRSMLLPWSLT